MVVPGDIMLLCMRKDTKLTSLDLPIRVTTEILIHVLYKFKGFRQNRDLLTYYGKIGRASCRERV